MLNCTRLEVEQVLRKFDLIELNHWQIWSLEYSLIIFYRDIIISLENLILFNITYIMFYVISLNQSNNIDYHVCYKGTILFIWTLNIYSIVTKSCIEMKRFSYLWVFEINFDSGQRKDQSSVKSHLSPWDGSIELLPVFEPFQRVNVSSAEKKAKVNFTNVPHAAFTRSHPKSAIKLLNLAVFLHFLDLHM